MNGYQNDHHSPLTSHDSPRTGRPPSPLASRPYNENHPSPRTDAEIFMSSSPDKPSTLRQLRESGWQSKPIKREIHDNFLAALARGDELFPGIVGYDSTVIPEINLALLAGHDLLFLGEKGQGKSRLMRSIVRFLDEELP